MPLYVFDTDALTLFRAGQAAICQRVAAHSPGDLATTVITVEEQLSGWYIVLRKAKQPPQLEQAYHQLAQTVQFFTGIQIVAFPLSAITRYQQLQTLKLNIRDFGRVPQLQIEDWAV